MKIKIIIKIRNPKKNIVVNKSNENKPTIQNKLTLWDLLKDLDTDISWSKNFTEDKEKNLENNEEGNEDSAANDENSDKIVGPPNPFSKAKENLLENEEREDIRLDMFHVAWRVVKRDQEVADLVSLTNNFFSILSRILPYEEFGLHVFFSSKTLI